MRRPGLPSAMGCGEQGGAQGTVPSRAPGAWEPVLPEARGEDAASPWRGTWYFEWTPRETDG